MKALRPIQAFAACLAVLLWTTFAFAADWTRVTGAQSQAGTGLSATLTIPAVGNGNAVLGGLLLSPTSVVTSCTDNQSNAYRVTTGSIDGGGTLASFQFRSVGLITNAPTSITCNVTPSSSTFWMIEDEFAPPTGTTAISLDGSQQLLNSASVATANFQTLNSDDLIYAISMSNGTTTTGAGFTAGQGSGTGFNSEWKIQATASSSVSGVFVQGTAGSNWITVVGISPVAQTRWEFRQLVSQRTVANATTGSASFPNAVAAGDVIVCSSAVDNAVTINSLTDDKGNNYLPNVLSPNVNGRRVFWSGGKVNNGPKTITITVSASSTTVFFLCNDFAPPPNTLSVAVDGGGLVNTTTDTGATTTTPNITTTKNGDLAYGMCEPSAAGMAPGNSFSMLNVQGATWGDAYLIQGAAGSINFACTHADPTGINQSLVTFSATPPGTNARQNIGGVEGISTGNTVGSRQGMSALTSPNLGPGVKEVPGPMASLLATPTYSMGIGTIYSCSRNFYVATTGSDAANGSQATPWLTIQHADATALQAGDCINVAAGTYNFSTSFIPTHGGNLASTTGYITYKCQTLNGCTTLFTGANGTNAHWGFNVPYIIVDGFDIDGGGAAQYGGLAKSCIDSSHADTNGSTHHIWILNNKIHDCGLSCIGTSDAEWQHFIHNEIYRCAWTSGFQGSGIGVVIPKVLGAAGTDYPTYTPTAQDNGYGPFHFVWAWNRVHDNGCSICLGSTVALTTTCNTHGNLTLDGCTSTGTTASFTGSISGTTLTTTTSQTLTAGQVLTGATATAVVQGTVITVGGTGTSFTVNNSQNVASQAMTAATIAKLELVTGPLGNSCIQPFTYVNTISGGTITLSRSATCTQTGISITFQSIQGTHTDGNGIIADTFCTGAIPSTCYPSQTLIAFNDVQTNGGRGIHVFGVLGATVANNSMYHNGIDASGIGQFSDLSHAGGNNCNYYNNIAYAVNTINSGACGGGFCTFPLNAGDPMSIGGSGNTYFNNVFFGSGGVITSDGEVTNYVAANNKGNNDPLYVNETSDVIGDLHLGSGSPALGYVHAQSYLPATNAGAYQ